MRGNFSQNKKNTKPKPKLSPSETGEKHATELLLVIKGRGAGLLIEWRKADGGKEPKACVVEGRPGEEGAKDRSP